MKIDTFIDIPLKNRNFQLKFILIFFFFYDFSFVSSFRNVSSFHFFGVTYGVPRAS